MWCIFFFKDTATSVINSLSLHDALPICQPFGVPAIGVRDVDVVIEERPDVTLGIIGARRAGRCRMLRSEEHTSELQSRPHLACRLLLINTIPPVTVARAASHTLTKHLQA